MHMFFPPFFLLLGPLSLITSSRMQNELFAQTHVRFLFYNHILKPWWSMPYHYRSSSNKLDYKGQTSCNLTNAMMPSFHLTPTNSKLGHTSKRKNCQIIGSNSKNHCTVSFFCFFVSSLATLFSGTTTWLRFSQSTIVRAENQCNQPPHRPRSWTAHLAGH